MPTMDTRFVLQGITFIWDENKARENPRHHDGITFEQAAEAFFDPFLKVVDASRNEEARDAIIGMDTRWNLLWLLLDSRVVDVLMTYNSTFVMLSSFNTSDSFD